jgi:hypothetical protein
MSASVLMMATHAVLVPQWRDTMAKRIAQPDPWLRLCEEMGTTEEVFAGGCATENLLRGTVAGASRGEFKIRERSGKLQALIGSRWCSVGRTADGKLVEVWNR